MKQIMEQLENVLLDEEIQSLLNEIFSKKIKETLRSCS